MHAIFPRTPAETTQLGSVILFSGTEQSIEGQIATRQNEEKQYDICAHFYTKNHTQGVLVNAPWREEVVNKIGTRCGDVHVECKYIQQSR